MLTCLGGMHKVYIELTEHCNLNCKSCFRSNLSHLPVHMGKEVFEKVLSAVACTETVVVGGVGEPTLHPGFGRCSQALAHENMEITSNAYEWDDGIIETLVSFYKKVTVSVDGLPCTFSNVRCFDFDIMAKNVKKLVERKKEAKSKFPFIHAQLVLTTENIKDIKELIPMLKRIGFQKLIISNLLPQNECDKDKIVYSQHVPKETRDYVNSWYPIGSVNQLPIKLPQLQLKTERRCNFVETNSVFITADGNAAPCYRFAHDGQEYVFGRKKSVRAYYFGNVSDMDISEIWRQKNYESFRLQNYADRYPSCVDCDNNECCDYINTSEADCMANVPSCADCLWSRGFVECP